MCILMVEDESLILEIMSESLEEAGYDVRTASTGGAAVAMIKDPANRFSVLVSDYHLPGTLTGADIAAAMRDRYPEIPVVLATGRPDVLDARWEAESGYVLVRKPYRPSELIRILRAMTLPGHAFVTRQ